ncbi:MAG: acetylornithine/succinylornithine family transaminase [Candidatus Aminicenantes bacterium]|nr:acetylornithine/succinylornithine family transaminase [Candidatus Aminicenantes bacterium]
MHYDFSWEKNHEFPCYPKRDLALIRGKKSVVWDQDGKKYIDCVSGHGTAFVGHCHPRVYKAVRRQSQNLITCPGIFYNDQRKILIKKLTEISPPYLKQFYFSNSGAESIEAAIKFARLATGKSEFISAFRGFHGRTLGALSATHNPKYRQDFLPLLPGFTHVPYNKVDKLADLVTENTAGIILEPVQGEGGVHIADPLYLKKVEQLCREQDILLIMDEIQTGLGRTGKMFAFQHFDIKPDIVCLAKSIAGGLPLGVTMGTDRISIKTGKHGSTFGGNPLSCTAASAVIHTIQEQRLDKAAARKGSYFLAKLKELRLPVIKEVRGIGLMIGIEIRVKVKPVILALMEKGVLALPAGPNIIRLLPPAVITYKEIDRVIETISNLLYSTYSQK